MGGIGANSKYQMGFLLDNLKIQNAVIEAAVKLQIPKLIFLGSSCIYPKLAPQPINENSLLSGFLEPTNEGYALAKIAGVRLCKAVFEEHNLEYISLMPTNLYGPRDNFDLTASHVLPAFIRRFVEAAESGAGTVTWWGSGSPLREFLHVNDLAQAVVLASEKYDLSLHLNVGSGEDLSIKELATEVATAAGYTGKI